LVCIPLNTNLLIKKRLHGKESKNKILETQRNKLVFKYIQI